MTEPPPKQPPDGGGTVSVPSVWEPQRVAELKKGMVGDTVSSSGSPPTGTAPVTDNGTARAARHAEWTQRLTKIATRPWKIKPDNELRKMVPAEEEALTAWIMGVLILDAPPAFLACTHTFVQRITYVKFFEDYLEGTVVAVVPPHLLMQEHVAEKTILMQLLASEPVGSKGYTTTCEWIRSVKRLFYNAETRRLTFVVKDQSVATKWHRQEVKLRNEKLLLLSTAKLEEEDDRSDIDNVTPNHATVLQYQVRVVAPGLGIDIIEQLIALSTEREVISIAREPRAREETYDSNFWVVVFNSEECPPQIKDVTHISAKEASIFIHHHQRYSRIPCFQCYDPTHSKSKCTRNGNDRQMQHHREFEAEIKQAKKLSALELQHMAPADRAKHIGNLSSSLGKVITNLKAKATQKALLIATPQTVDSNGATSATTAETEVATSVIAPTSEKPSEGWIDPATQRKGKAAKKQPTSPAPAVQASSTTASKPRPSNAEAAPTGARGPSVDSQTSETTIQAVPHKTNPKAERNGTPGTKDSHSKAKADSDKPKQKTLAARRQQESALADVLNGKTPTKVTHQTPAPSTSKPSKPRLDDETKVTNAQTAMTSAKEGLAMAVAKHNAAVKAAASAKKEFHDVSAMAHNMALERDQLNGTTATANGDDSEAAKQSVDQLQRRIETLDLQHRAANRAVDEAHQALADAKTAKSRAKKHLDKVQKRSKAESRNPLGENQKPDVSATAEETVSDSGKKAESECDQELAYTKIRDYIRANVQQQQANAELHEDDKETGSVQSGTSSAPSAKVSSGSGGQQGPQKLTEEATHGDGSGPPQFDVTMAQAESSSMDSTMHLHDLNGGTVTPPNGQATLPLPTGVTEAFQQEQSMGHASDNADNVINPVDRTASPHVPSSEQQDVMPSSTRVSSEQSSNDNKTHVTTESSGTNTSGCDSDEHHFQEPEREPDLHSKTLNQPRERKISEYASSVLKSAASVDPTPAERILHKPSLLGNTMVTHKEPDVVEMHTQSTMDPPLTIDEWVSSLQLVRIPTEANGHCLFYAIRHALNVNHAAQLPSGTVDQQTNWVKVNIMNQFWNLLHDTQNLEHFDVDKLYTKLTTRLPNHDLSREDKVGQIDLHLRQATAISVAEPLPVAYWGATDELRMAALWLKMPIFVLDQQPDGTTFVVKYVRAENGEAKMILLHTSVARVELFPTLWNGNSILLIRSGESLLSHFAAAKLQEYASAIASQPSLSTAEHSQDTQNSNPTSSVIEFESQSSSSPAVAGSSNADESDDVAPPPLPQFRSNAVHNTRELAERLVGTKEDISQLSTEEQAIRRQHLRVNNKAMHEWIAAARHARTYGLPVIEPADVTKLAGWVPTHVDALSAICRVLPFPLEVLRTFPIKKLFEFGHSINSQAQRALIRHHSNDESISSQARTLCKKWIAAIDACPHGSARWSMTDDIKRWNRLDKIDNSLLAATVEKQVDSNKWAILNVVSLLMPRTFEQHGDVGAVMPETRAKEYWQSSSLQCAIDAIVDPKTSWSLMVHQCELDAQRRSNRS